MLNDFKVTHNASLDLSPLRLMALGGKRNCDRRAEFLWTEIVAPALISTPISRSAPVSMVVLRSDAISNPVLEPGVFP